MNATDSIRFHRLRRLRHGPVLALLLAAAGIGPTIAAAQDPQEAKVDALFAEWSSTHTPGATVAVIRDGKTILARGYGMADLEQGSPNRPETVFSIASMSKQFAAASIALLVEQGKLRLDQDVRTIVPELPDYGHVITIDNLVHHTSGLRDYLGLWSLSGHSMTDSMPEQQILDLIVRQKETNFVPGAEYLYSNTGYQLISLIVHRVSGEPLSAFAEKNIFAPLGMRHTHFHDDVTRMVPFVAAPYERRDDGSFALVRTQVALVGAGKLYTTVGDLALWDRNFYDNKLGKGGPALIERLLSTVTLNDGKPIEYAFGLGVSHYRGLDVVEHSGGSTGIATMMMRFPGQRFSVIVLSNLGQMDASELAARIADIYLDGQLAAPKASAEEQRRANGGTPAPALQLSTTELAALAGDYYSDELDAVYRVAADDGKLAVQAGAYLRATLVPLSEDRFRLEGEGAQGQFIRDASGRVQGFTLNAGRVKHLRFQRRAP